MGADEISESAIAADSPPDKNSDRRGSRLISRLLPPAVRLWVQTQLDAVSNLNFQLRGRDGQILKGHIPQVSVSADRAVYRGIHLSHVEVEATEIYINLGQVVRGKTLRLLQPFLVIGEVVMLEADLNDSLASEILQSAISDFLTHLLSAQPAHSPLTAQLAHLRGVDSWNQTVSQARITDGQLQLTLISPNLPQKAVVITSGLTVRDGHILILERPTLALQDGEDEVMGTTETGAHLRGFEIDLGPEVYLHDLSFGNGRLHLQGQIRVRPGH